MRFAGDLGCTSYRLHRAALAAHRFYESRVAESGLSMAQFGLLATLRELDGSGVSGLAAAMGLDRTTMTRGLQALQERGMVSVTDGKDGRTRAVFLTDEGREAFSRTLPFWQEAQDSVAANLGPDLLMELHRGLEAAIDRMPT